MNIRAISKGLPQYVVVALILSLMMVEWLRGGPDSSNLPHSFQDLRDQAISLALAKTFQSGGVLTLFFYHLLLLWVKAARKRLTPGVKLRWWNKLDRRDWCKLVVVLCSVVGYTADWATTPDVGIAHSLISGIDQSTNVLVFLAGMVLSQIVEMAQENGRLRLSFGRVSLIILMVFLAAGSLARHEGAFIFKYRGEIRATGLWVNPNTYGLLMGVGLVLALAYLLDIARSVQMGQSCKSHGNGNFQGYERSFGVMRPLPVSLKCYYGGVVAVLLIVGLIRSYSRGAWLGTLMGTIFLCFSISGSADRSNRGKLWNSRLHGAMDWLRQNIWMGLAICGSLALFLTFRLMHSEHLVVRRMVSVANVNDFSWRNRALAWEGALQIIADHPVNGVGWHRVGYEFRQFYAPPQLTEDLAIILNDYLTLGMALGLPALACFVALLRTSFHDYLRVGSQWEWVVAASRSALIVLLIGFWFDGGLFKLALATPFWLFLELAVARKRGPK